MISNKMLSMVRKVLILIEKLVILFNGNIILKTNESFNSLRNTHLLFVFQIITIQSQILHNSYFVS